MPISNPLHPKIVFAHQNAPVIENAQKNNELYPRILDVGKLTVTFNFVNDNLFGDGAFEAIKNSHAVDGAIKLCFRSGCKNEAQMGLASFVNAIKSSCNQFTFCDIEVGQ